MREHVKTLLLLGIIVSAYGLGAWIERADSEAWRLTLARHCVSTATIDRYTSHGLDGFVCFSQKADTKKINKAVLVIDGI